MFDVSEKQVGVCSCGRPLKVGIVSGKEVKIRCECEKAKEEAEKKAKAEANRQRKLAEIRRAAHIPIKLTNCTFESWVERPGEDKAYRASKRFADTFPKIKQGLIFVGNTGSGKTHLATAILNAVLDKGYSGRFYRAADIPIDIQASYNSNSISEYEIMLQLKTVKLLVLDDLGADKMTEFDRGIIHSIIDSRINYCLPTIITTNVPPDKMSDILDSRTVDRLLGSDFYLFTLTDESYRRTR